VKADAICGSSATSVMNFDTTPSYSPVRRGAAAAAVPARTAQTRQPGGRCHGQQREFPTGPQLQTLQCASQICHRSRSSGSSARCRRGRRQPQCPAPTSCWPQAARCPPSGCRLGPSGQTASGPHPIACRCHLACLAARPTPISTRSLRPAATLLM
jgi:hypothetical protein